MRFRFEQTWIAFEQLIHALVFKGWADETISSKACRRYGTSIWWNALVKIIDTLVFWDKNHCYRSYHSERGRRYLAPEMREGGDENDYD